MTTLRIDFVTTKFHLRVKFASIVYFRRLRRIGTGKAMNRKADFLVEKLSKQMI